MSLNVPVATPIGSNPDGPGTATGGKGVLDRSAGEAWAARVEIARKSGHPEDIEVLADEAPSAALRVSARKLAEEILRHRDARKSPATVFLFSGHMLDTPDRPIPRFPPDKESIAAACIGEALDRLGAGPNDLAIAQGAAGGDILFGEACLARRVRFRMLLPLSEPAFIAASVLPCCDGESWRQRYLALRARLSLPPRIMPDVLGPPPRDRDGKPGDPYERCNRWLLYSALAQGRDRLRFISLWDGSGGDGPGGTAHMVGEVRRRHCQITWLDTRELW